MSSTYQPIIIIVILATIYSLIMAKLRRAHSIESAPSTHSTKSIHSIHSIESTDSIDSSHSSNSSMSDPTSEITTFLSLPHELRQQLLLDSFDVVDGTVAEQRRITVLWEVDERVIDDMRWVEWEWRRRNSRMFMT